MPKTDIDYSNTIIYKIMCNDVNNKDVYIGHTTNFVQRKHAHKQSCLNEKSPNYKCKLYEVIRNNGGWNNWKMEIVNFFNCKDHYEARQREQEYFVSLNATLNSIEPLPQPKSLSKTKILPQYNSIPNNIQFINNNNNTPFFCDKCNFKCYKKSNYNMHLLTVKHKKLIIQDPCNDNQQNNIKKMYFCFCGKKYNHASSLCKHKKICSLLNDINNNIIIENLQTNQNSQTNQNTSEFFYCEKCNFECCKKSSFTKHTLTFKHINNNNNNQLLKIPKKYLCNCGKEYVYRQGLYLHKKICKFIKEQNHNINNNNTDNNCNKIDELINYLTKENQEFKGLILEVCKNLQQTNTH